MRNLLSTLIIYLLAAIPMSAQVPQEPTYGMTPNAKSFQRYGDIPVSLYTGTPDISIPLATLREGELTLPISLSYHSGGIKADEHPGWTGLGWTLMAGGAITREIRDIPDETSKLGYYTSYKELAIDKFTAYNIGDIIYGSSAGAFELKDTEPDKFNFSFPGYSGFFMLGPDGTWMVSCDRPIKVEADKPIAPKIRFPNGSSTYLSAELIFPKFTLTADDGVKYTFGNDAVEVSICSNNQFYDEWKATSWHLIEIRHPNGDAITFNYERGEFIAQLSNSVVNITAGNNRFVALGGKSGQIMSPVYLKSITASTFNVKLESSESCELNYSGNDYRECSTKIGPGITTTRSTYCPYDANNAMRDEISWRQLDRITLSDNRSRQFRAVNFRYSNSPAQRLTLLGFNICGRDDNTDEKYSFTYDQIDKLPEYLTGKDDHWGYYSELSASADSPQYKQTDPDHTGYGVLTSITYPTGGKTILEFEPHYYTRILNDLEQLNDSGYAGGVRIKRIINIPRDGSQPEIKKYAYVSGYAPGINLSDCQGSGMLEGKPVHTHTMLYLVSNKTPINITEESNKSLSSIVNNCGFHIGYPTVFEIREDSSYTQHEFIPPTYPGMRDEFPISSSDSKAFVPHSTKAQYRGKPLSKTMYNADGRCIMSEITGYDIVGHTQRWIQALYFTSVELREVNSKYTPFLYIKYSLYRNYIHTTAEARKSVTYYGTNGRDYQETINLKQYNLDGQIKTDSIITKFNGRQITDVTNYRYQWESDNWFSSNHFKNSVSDITRRHNGTTLSHLHNRYTLFNNKFPVLSTVTELYDGSDRRQLYELGRSDSKGKPVQIKNADGLYTVYLWGADRIYPVAEIKNADASQVRKVLGYDPEDAPDDPNIQANINKLRAAMPQCLVTSYTYVPYLGITSITDPAQKTTYFGYDMQSRLTHVWDDAGAVVKQYDYNTFSGKSSGLINPQSHSTAP